MVFSNSPHDRSLIAKIQALSPEQIAEVEDFAEFLSAKMGRRAALDRLPTIASALEIKAKALSDNQAAEQLNLAKQWLFQSIFNESQSAA